MRSLVSLLVLVLLAGCGSLKGCGGSPRSSVPAAAATSAPAIAPAPPAPEPPAARFARKYLVIVHSSHTAGEGEAIVEKLRAAGLGSGVRRLSTTPFASLRPCLEVVVAGAFAEKAAGLELSGRLEAAGVENYLKNAGELARDREQREEGCQELARARAAAATRALPAQGPFLVETRGERTFLLLVSGEPLNVPSPELRQVGEDRGFWMAPLKEDPTGVLKKGARFDVYDDHRRVKAGCQVKGFAMLQRGQPHFSFFQRQEAPEAPECGASWPVAELDCSLAGTRAMGSEAIVFALAAGRPEPQYLHRTDALPEHVRQAQEAALRALPEYEATRASGQAHAAEQGEPLRESLEVHAYRLGERMVVVTLARFQTGEGHTLCGGEDFRATVSRVVAVGPDEREELVGGGLDAESLVALLDLEGDGRVELMTRGVMDASQVALVGEEGEELVSSFVPNCDCGC